MSTIIFDSRQSDVDPIKYFCDKCNDTWILNQVESYGINISKNRIVCTKCNGLITVEDSANQVFYGDKVFIIRGRCDICDSNGILLYFDCEVSKSQVLNHQPSEG